MTFLEMVRRACSESGTVARDAPESVAAAQGIVRNWVKWVSSAYSDIQTMETSWRWLRREVDAVIPSGMERVSPAVLGAARFRSWRFCSDRGWPLWTIYDPAKGLSDEAEIQIAEYETLVRHARGESQTGRPYVVAEDDERRLFLWPVPDKDYRLRFTYNRGPQILADDGDVPEMPAECHEVIVYRALIKNLNYDQAMEQFPYWRREEQRMMADLRDGQLPKLGWGGPLV